MKSAGFNKRYREVSDNRVGICEDLRNFKRPVEAGHWIAEGVFDTIGLVSGCEDGGKLIGEAGESNVRITGSGHVPSVCVGVSRSQICKK